MTKNMNNSSLSISTKLLKKNKKHQKMKVKKRNPKSKHLWKAVPIKSTQSQGYVLITAKASRIAFMFWFQNIDSSIPSNCLCFNHMTSNHTKSLPLKNPKCRQAKNFNKTRTFIRFMIFKASVIVTNCRWTLLSKSHDR